MDHSRILEAFRRQVLVTPKRANFQGQQSLDMALLDPILAGVVSSTEGVASADLTLQGQGRKAELEGEIRVAGLKTTVDFTQVTYSMPEAVLNVKNNRLARLRSGISSLMIESALEFKYTLATGNLKR